MSETGKSVKMGREEPLPIKALPDPPRMSHYFGPAMVLTALGVGLGETFMWPRLVIVFGPEIRWLSLVGLLIQTVVTLEMARWAMATGESIFFGASRVARPLMWFFWLIAMTIYIWPGHVSLGAQSFSKISGVPWTWIAVAGIGFIAVAITLAPVVYKLVQTVLTWFITFMTIISGVIASMVGTPTELWRAFAGTFAFGWWHKDILTATWFPIIVGSIAFIGPSGMQQMWFTLWIRDFGAGMGKYIGRITSWLTGEAEAVPERGYTFDTSSATELRKWKKWRSWNMFDAFVLFFGLTFLTTLVFTVLAMSATRLSPAALGPIKAGKTVEALNLISGAFVTVGGPAFFYLYFLLMGIVGWKMDFGIFEAFSRGQSDMTYFGIKAARRWPLRIWYYFYLYFVCGFGAVVILLASAMAAGPAFILNVLAFLSTFVMGSYCVLLIYVNNRLLPKELRPRWYNNVSLGMGALFYLGALAYSVLVLGAVPRA